MIVDLFAGPGGWDTGLRMLGVTDVVGVEHDAATCETRAATGHLTIRGDVSQVALHGRFDGMIASPPCPTFSNAGDRAGMSDLPTLHAHAHACQTGWKDYDPAEFSDPRTPLVLEPLRWAHTLVPDWISLEQVPPVLPLWETFAAVLRAWGWRTWTGVLNSADYGVPQTRQRAILMAHRRFQPQPPEPTHVRGGASTMFGDLAPWVSMAEALGLDEFTQPRADGSQLDTAAPAPVVCGHREPAWMFPRVGFPRRDDRGDSDDGYRERDMRSAGEPAFALTEKARSWVIRTNNVQGGSDHYYERDTDQPAPTILPLARSWTLHTNRDQRDDGARQEVDGSRPAPSLTAKSGGQWAFARPATTIAGDPRCWPPGHKENSNDPPGKYQQRRGEQAIRLTIRDALILQSFPQDYPVQGTKTAQFRQVGDAVPPRLAAHILAALLEMEARVS